MRITSLVICILLFPLWIGMADANDFTGTWEYHGPSEAAMWLKTHQMGNKVRFQLEISRGAPSYNSGWIEGKFLLKGNSGIFQSVEYSDCAIKFKFSESKVQLSEVNQDQDCGFGHHVYAEGTLKIKSRKKPKFSKGDPRSGEE